MGCEMREERPFPSSCARPQGAFYFSILASFWGDTQQKPLRRRVFQKEKQYGAHKSYTISENISLRKIYSI